MWDCIDLCHEAIIKSKDKFIELEAEILSLLGKIYGKILKLEDKAKNYYKECFSLTEALKPKLLTNYKWYMDSISARSKIIRHISDTFKLLYLNKIYTRFCRSIRLWPYDREKRVLIMLA